MNEYLRQEMARSAVLTLSIGIFGTLMYLKGKKAGYDSGYEEGSRRGRGFLELSQQAMRQNIRVMNEINRQSSENEKEGFDFE